MNYTKLWGGAVLTQVGDILTTFYGITQLGLKEANPLMRPLFEAIGMVPTLLLAKTLLFCLAYALHRWKDDTHDWVIPTCILIVGTITLALNINTIAVAM